MPTALILAAGASTRLGQPKQLVTLRGETLIRRSVRVAREAGCEQVVVVQGAVSLVDSVGPQPGVHLTWAHDWSAGQGASIRAGLQAVVDADVVVLLVDHWRVEVEALRAFLSAPGEVVAARYEGVLGVPARFRGSALAHLREVSLSSGAKHWLRSHASEVTAVEWPEAGVDCDTPEALAALRRFES